MKLLKNTPCFLIKNKNEEILLTDKAEYNNVELSMRVDETDGYVLLHIELLNKNDFIYQPQKISVKLGIDTYMASYPEWNDKFFPSMLRFEKTHMYGYFMSPVGGVIGICCDSAAAGYSFDYSITGDDCGHRIENVNFDIICEPPLPERFSDTVTYLKPHEKRSLNIYLLPGLDEKSVFEKINGILGAPIITSKKYTIEKGEDIQYSIISDKKYNVTITSPNGLPMKNTEESGIYTLTVKQEDGREAQALYYVRNSYEWYLKKAAENMILKPQKATTHCESWYGFFSGYLAMKHYPNTQRDKITNAMFDEIMPMMFDFDSAKPKVIPWRIQNTSAFISLLVDRYEAEGNDKYLKLASLYGDWLIKTQKADGGYYNQNTHYTCVIYPAKSLMELYHAELRHHDEYFREKGKEHYQSVKRAVDDLAERLDNVETEGEMTFEDGMISCAALQMAYFAFDVPSLERGKYINAAEYMMNKHRCLEQNNIPDCRMNGASIRYWEAQYDVNYKGNMLNSPHGWTAWTLYAKFYLFLLTGKAIYLKELENGIGACIQLMNLDGDLRWAFICEPHLQTQIFVRDSKKKITDAYDSVKFSDSGYCGKYLNAVISEQYAPMISDWYRVSEENHVVGGYKNCPLFLENKTLYINNQGGACDNDVHEIFKCIEETVLKKAFIAKEDGELLCYGCTAVVDDGCIHIMLEDDTEILYSGIKGELDVSGGNSPDIVFAGDFV